MQPLRADASPADGAIALTSANHVNIVRGFTAQVPLTITRADGFADAVVVSVVDLPGGVTAEPLVVPSGATSATLTLHAKLDASLGVDGRLAVQGTSGPVVSPVTSLPIVVQDPAGTLDLTFGTGGVATFTLTGANNSAIAYNGLLIQPDGRIAFCGNMKTQQGNTGFQLLVGRLLADGSLDSSFPGQGIFTTLAPNYNSEVCYALQLAPSGDLTLAGFSSTAANHMMFAARMTENGLDRTFAHGAGYLSIWNGDVDSKAKALLVQPDGKLVLGGFQPWGTMALVRLMPNGLADPTFDPKPLGSSETIGVNTYPDAGSSINALALLPDGAILSAVEDPDFRAIRFNSQGAIDTTYGTSGTASTRASGALLSGDAASGAVAILVHPSGAVILVGSTHSTIEAARFTATGALDGSFGTGGRASTPIGGSGGASTCAAAMTPNGGFVVAASFNTTKPIGVVRFTADGALDTTFNGVGFAGFTSGAAGGPEAIALDAAGRIVVAASNGGVVSLARFWP